MTSVKFPVESQESLSTKTCYFVVPVLIAKARWSWRWRWGGVQTEDAGSPLEERDTTAGLAVSSESHSGGDGRRARAKC